MKIEGYQSIRSKINYFLGMLLLIVLVFSTLIVTHATSEGSLTSWDTYLTLVVLIIFLFAITFVWYFLNRFLTKSLLYRDYTNNIISSMMDTLMVIGPDGRIKTINKATSDLSGYSKDELIDEPVATIIGGKVEGPVVYDEPEDVVEFLVRLDLNEAIVGDGIDDHELNYVTKTGEKIPMSFSCSVVWNEKDELLGVVCVARDIRERKRLVQKEKELVVAKITAEAERKRVAELTEAYKKLEKADLELKDATAQLVQNEKLTALGEMAAGVAHELNQPLHGIKLISQGLLRNIEKRGFDQKMVSENLQETVGLANRMSGIIDHMRLFSRHPRGEQGGEVDVNEAVEGVFKLLGQQLYVNNIEVRKELSPNIPNALINQVGLEQVLMNLIINARHAMEESGRKPMTIEIKSFLKEKDGSKEAVVSVRDNAGGVPKDIQTKIFEPFFTTKEPGKGTGLGLSVSRKIIADAGGKIELEVDEGIGSTFSVILPIKK